MKRMEYKKNEDRLIIIETKDTKEPRSQNKYNPKAVLIKGNFGSNSK